MIASNKFWFLLPGDRSCSFSVNSRLWIAHEHQKLDCHHQVMWWGIGKILGNDDGGTLVLPEMTTNETLLNSVVKNNHSVVYNLNFTFFRVFLSKGTHVGVIKWKLFVILALCEGNSPVTGEFPSQRPVTRSFDIFFDLHLNKWLSKQSIRWWFEMPSRSFWHHCNANHMWHITSG